MTVLNTLLEITLYSGIIFFATMLIKKTFRNKMSPFLHFAIWAIFLLRLIVPVTIDAPLGIFTYQVKPAVTPISAGLPTPERNIADTDTIVILQDEKTDTVLAYTQRTITTPEPTPDPVTAPVSARIEYASKLNLSDIVLIVWLSGACLGLAYIALLSILLARKIARKSAPASANLQRLLADVEAELHIKNKFKIVCQYEYGSPALLFPHTIIMPINKLAELSDAQIKNCLRHECMHYKRGDQFVSLLLSVLNAVYWFNPFMWLAYYEMRKDMETACDGAVVKHIEPCARRGYAELILSLSSQTRRMQFALGMANSRKNAERRIKGVFMTQRTKRSVKFISSVLALLLLFGCFTTACKPTPAKPAVINKSGGITADMIDEPLPQGTVKDVDAPTHWKETITRLNGHMLINADADVKLPENLSDTPVNKIEQTELTQQRLNELTHYFVGNSKLYKPLPMTSFEGMIQLKKIKDGTGMYGEFNDSARKHMADTLEELIGAAPAEAEKTYTNLSFTQPYNSEHDLMIDGWLKAENMNGYLKNKGEKYVDVYAETGEDYEPMISASTYDNFGVIPSNFNFAYPGSFLTANDIEQLVRYHERYTASTIAETLKTFIAKSNQYYSELSHVVNAITETPEQALNDAKKVIEDLKINDMSLSRIENGVWLPRLPQEWDDLSTPVSKAVGGYSVVFTRSAGQLAGFRENYNGFDAKDMLSYTPPFRVEEIRMFISNGKILQFNWRSMAQTVETVAKNTKLLPFDEIKERLADCLSYNFPYDGPDNGSFSVEIVDVQLRASQITAKDDPFRAWIVPSWVFTIRQDYSKWGNTETTISADYPCEINALDGGIIIPK